jgi:hypothetical protein
LSWLRIFFDAYLWFLIQLISSQKKFKPLKSNKGRV